MEELGNQYNNIITLMGTLLASIQAEYFKCLDKGDDNLKLKGAMMHCSHALGEMLESKAVVGEELNAAEKMIMDVYEKEMDMALDNLAQRVLFTEILNNGENNGKS